MKKKHKVGICKVLGRSVINSAFYAGICLCPKSEHQIKNKYNSYMYADFSAIHGSFSI